MHDEPIVALVLAQPGPLRDGLAALLSAIPAIDAVHITGDLAEGVGLVTGAGQAVILADVSCMSEEGVRSSLEEFRRASPAALIVLLVNTGSEQTANEMTVADAVVLKGFPAARLSALIETHLHRSRD